MKMILILFALAALADLAGGPVVSPDAALAIPILPIILGGAAALNAISGAVQGHRANQLQRRGLSLAEQDFASRAPARDAALARLLGPMPTAPDLSAGFADPGNPFAAVNRVPPPPSLATPSAAEPGQTAPRILPAPQNSMMMHARDTLPRVVLDRILGAA